MRISWLVLLFLFGLVCLCISVSADENVYVEDFEDDADNANPSDDWYTYSETADFKCDSGRPHTGSLGFIDPAVDANGHAKFDLDTDREVTNFTFWYLGEVDNLETWYLYIELFSEDGEIIEFEMIDDRASDDDISLNGNSQGFDWSAMTWYECNLELNWSDDTFRGRINGVWSSWYDFSTTGSVLDYFYVRATDDRFGCLASVDDFSLTYVFTVPNTAPEFSVISPANNSVGNPILTCSIAVNITDAEGDLFNYSWACSDGSNNLAVGNSNGTKYLILDNCYNHECGTTYSWWINATDGKDYTNETFYFTTEDCESSYLSITPENNSVNICPCTASVCFDIASNGFNVNYSVYISNDTGFRLIDSQSNVSDGEYCVCVCCLRYNETYEWYVNVSKYGDDSVYNQSDVFVFSTAEDINSCIPIYGGDNMEVSFSEFSIIISFLLFVFWMWLGYTSEKRSGGAFMVFAGFTLFYMEVLLVPYVSAVFVIPFISPLAIFIILLGFKKFLYSDSDENKKMRD